MVTRKTLQFFPFCFKFFPFRIVRKTEIMSETTVARAVRFARAQLGGGRSGGDVLNRADDLARFGSAQWTDCAERVYGFGYAFFAKFVEAVRDHGIRVVAQAYGTFVFPPSSFTSSRIRGIHILPTAKFPPSSVLFTDPFVINKLLSRDFFFY